MTARGSVPRDFPLFNFLGADKVQEKKKKKLWKKEPVCPVWSTYSPSVKLGLGNEGLLQPPFPPPFIANYLKFSLIHHFC